MNRRIVALNLALLALAGLLAWRLRVKWLDAKSHATATLSQPARPPALVAPPAAPVPAAVTAGDYLDVAQKTLFSKDRNPIPVPDAPKPAPPPPPMPALPVYHGQMSLGDPVVVLSTASSPAQKSYAVGDKIGEFKVVAFDQDTITFDWNGKTVERKITELAPKEAPLPVAAAPAPAAAAPPAAAVTSLAGGAAASQNSDKPPAVGTDMGGGFRACVAGDNSPAGTVLNGYKKVISRGLMGQTCYWEQSK